MVVKNQRVGFPVQQVFNKLLEQKTTGGNALGVRQLQFAIILHEHRVTCRFEKNDRRVVLVAVQQREIVASQSRGFVEVALAEGGPSATFSQFRQHDFKARGFEHLDGGHADVRFVIAHESVVPKDDPAAEFAGMRFCVWRTSDQTAPAQIAAAAAWW